MDKFWKLYFEAIEKAQCLTEEKSKDYVGDESIYDYWINGVQDLLYEINKKVLRLRRQQKNKKSNLTDGIEDSAIDLINYSAFLYAFLKSKE